jgi:ABC-2 type transport system ATP-binding protein
MIIQLSAITKAFTDRSWHTLMRRRTAKRVEALKGVSLEIRRGEVFGLLGPNGAGKTTLIKILATLILPDSGRGTVCGHDLTTRPHQVRDKIGLVNTNTRSFYWRLTGRQNLHFFAALYNLNGAAGSRRVEEILESAGLTERADGRFMTYSTGEQQRLALARAMLPAPDVLLMDEPTNSLDPVAASELRTFAKTDLAEKQGKTILWCTHNLREAQAVCGRMAIIHRGEVIALGSMAEMQKILGDDHAYSIKVDRMVPAALEDKGLVPLRMVGRNGHVELEFRGEDESIPELLSSLVARGIKIYGCTRKEPDLETIFERIVGVDKGVD